MSPSIQSQAPNITLYTNHGCGWSRRVQIMLRELNLDYDEVIIDLDKEKPNWFLQLNPRGQVPVLKYTSQPSEATESTLILIESSRIAYFLQEIHAPTFGLDIQSTLDTNQYSYHRYRVSEFVDIYFSRINPLMFNLVREPLQNVRETKAEELAVTVHRELDGLLPQHIDGNEGPPGPFFGGSNVLTMAEVMVAPFVQILYDYSVGGIIIPAKLPLLLDQSVDGRDGKSQFGAWAETIRKHPSCLHLWDAQLRRTRVEQRLGRMRPGAASPADEKK